MLHYFGNQLLHWYHRLHRCPSLRPTPYPNHLILQNKNHILLQPNKSHFHRLQRCCNCKPLNSCTLRFHLHCKFHRCHCPSPIRLRNRPFHPNTSRNPMHMCTNRYPLPGCCNCMPLVFDIPKFHLDCKRRRCPHPHSRPSPTHWFPPNRKSNQMGIHIRRQLQWHSH